MEVFRFVALTKSAALDKLPNPAVGKWVVEGCTPAMERLLNAFMSPVMCLNE
jgi:hypothetical protein